MASLFRSFFGTADHQDWRRRPSSTSSAESGATSNRSPIRLIRRLRANRRSNQQDDFDDVMDMMNELEDQDFDEYWQVSGITTRPSTAAASRGRGNGGFLARGGGAPRRQGLQRESGGGRRALTGKR